MIFLFLLLHILVGQIKVSHTDLLLDTRMDLDLNLGFGGAGNCAGL